MKSRLVAIGSDHGGFALKEALVAFLESRGIPVKDFGAYSEESMDYPDTALGVARAVARRKACCGILVCKTGIGNSIVANKVKGVRAALCYNLKAAVLSRQHNNANVLVLGAFFVSAAQAKKITQAWLSTDFEAGRHSRRLKKIERIEASCARA